MSITKRPDSPFDEASDEDLVTLVKSAPSHDQRAFETLVRRYQAFVAGQVPRDCPGRDRAIAFGVPVGLGSRDMTRNVLAGLYARKIFQPGDPIEVRGHRGVFRAITATQTLIDQDTGLLSIANSVFLDEIIRH